MTYLEQEAAMLDADGYIIDRSPCDRMILDDDFDAGLSALYVEPPTWEQITSVIGAVGSFHHMMLTI